MPANNDTIRVLVVEDEESYREAISSGLRAEGYDVEVVPDGTEGLRSFVDRPPDIVLLDMLLPGIRGTEVCRRMREISTVPILMVSAVDSELDIVLGLELGATDYVTKPFRIRELVARIQAILRRVSPPSTPEPDRLRSGPVDASLPAPDGEQRQERFGPVLVDFARREVTVDGKMAHLSKREFDLLATLLTPAQQVRTRDELIDRLWPDRYLADSRTLDTHIHRLRTKLEPDPSRPRYIVTVRGVGFRLDPDDPRPPAPLSMPTTPRSSAP